MGIDRLRMGSDGNGITSLVTFYGCPLKCRFCLNPQCHKDLSSITFSKPKEVFDVVATDELYYLATGGGVTFGGGEPLLYSDFILEVLKLGAKKWNITIETSLNVKYEQFDIISPYINEIIIDIKDINTQIYEKYTRHSNTLVINNLKRLANSDYNNKILIRIPLIAGYNTEDDIMNSKVFLENLGYSNFDFFKYKTDNNDRKR